MSTEAPDILSPEFAADPYSAYRRMREQHPLIWHEPVQSYLISRYADVERAFKDPVFTSRNYDWQLEPVHGRTILQMDGREHSTHRNLVAPAFRGRDLAEKFVPVIERNSRELIDAFRGDGEVDLVDRYATRFPIDVIVDMLGLPRSDHDHFHRWYTSIMAFLSNLAGDEQVMADGIRTRGEFEEYLIPVIRERREHPGDDLLSALCTAEIDGVRMTDQEIKAFCSLLLTAGGETTDKAITSDRAYTAGANHTAFALGRHFCVGAMLARTELEIGIAQLLDAMDDIGFADGVPPPEHGVFTRAPAALPLTFTSIP